MTDKVAGLEELVIVHRTIDKEVGELSTRKHLLQSEQLRLKSLKVQKLRIKDVICRLTGG